MGKIFFGFVAGASATLIVSHLMSRGLHVQPKSSVAADTPARLAPIQAAGPPNDSSLRSVVSPESELPVYPISEVPSLGELAQLRREADAAEAVWRRLKFQFNQGLAELPVEHPIELPSEFDWLSDRASIPHAFIQRESVDPDWAPMAESQIAGFFARRPELIQKYGYPTVVCRTTRCEVQFVSYAANESQTQTIMRWSGIAANIFEEEWALQFQSNAEFGHPANSYHDVNEQDGVTTILWHLWKSAE